MNKETKHKALTILDIGQLTKKNLQKLELTGPICELIGKETLTERVLPILENDGLGFFYKKNKQVVALFLVHLEEAIKDADSETPEASEAQESKKKKKTEIKNYQLVLDFEYVIDEYKEDYEQIKKDSIETAMEYAALKMTGNNFGRISTAVWNDDIYTISEKTVNVLGTALPLSLMWLSVGMLLGYMQGHLMSGIVWGLLLAIIFGSTTSINVKKKNEITKTDSSEEETEPTTDEEV